jgi:hypothetical protein
MTLTPISEALRQARAELAERRPEPTQDAALLTRLTRLQQAQSLRPALASGPSLPRQAAWGGAWLAGGLFLLAAALLLLEPPGRAWTPDRLPADSGFLPVVSPDEWRRAMAGEAQAAVWLMPTELPRERLALLGLPFDATRANEPVRAELMLHPSGQLLAVRFVQ